MLEIREMRPEDLERVAEIENKIFSMPWSREGFAESLEQDYTLYLTAVQDGGIIGYCGMAQAFEEAEITNVAVEEKSRGQGTAEKMLRELLRRGEEKGISRYILEMRRRGVCMRSWALRMWASGRGFMRGRRRMRSLW